MTWLQKSQGGLQSSQGGLQSSQVSRGRFIRRKKLKKDDGERKAASPSSTEFFFTDTAPERPTDLIDDYTNPPLPIQSCPEEEFWDSEERAWWFKWVRESSAHDSLRVYPKDHPKLWRIIHNMNITIEKIALEDKVPKEAAIAWLEWFPREHDIGKKDRSKWFYFTKPNGALHFRQEFTVFYRQWKRRKAEAADRAGKKIYLQGQGWRDVY